VLIANEILIQRLFGWQREEIRLALNELESREMIQSGIEIEGERGNWLGWKNF
jgi:hypothetical protein